METLANIQNEVGLPTNAPTEGEAYALQTYGIDGWGNELRLAIIENPDPYGASQEAYEVTSAGADGVLDTEDDLSVVVAPTNDSDFDYGQRAWFVTEREGVHYVFFHRWSGSLFEYNHEELAAALTGSALFDVFPLEDFSPSLRPTVAAAFDDIAAGAEHTPLVLEVYQDS